MGVAARQNWGHHGLVLFVPLATAASILGALAASLTSDEVNAPPAMAAWASTWTHDPPMATPTAANAPCDCAGNGRSPAVAPAPSARTLSPGAADDAARSRRPAFRAEANSYARQLRAEADPRSILARLAELSRRAPRSFAVDPGFGGAAKVNR